MVERTLLAEGWTLTPVGDLARVPYAVVEAGRTGIAATVPGCVHTDLLAAGLIPDPYHDRNEADLGWIGRTDWCYATTFEHDPGAAAGADEHVELVCDGLDTVATLELNGQVVGRSANMHRRYRFDVGAAVVAGQNRLTVTFAAPEIYARAQERELGVRPGANVASPAPFNAMRKMACNFGWDWGPVLLTSGIWRPIAIERWTGARLSSVRPQVGLTGAVGASEPPAGSVSVALAVDGAAEGLLARVQVAGQVAEVPVVDGRAGAELTAPGVDVWWPHGHGAQPRYDLAVELVCDGAVLDRWVRKVGFRTVELDTSTDEIGTAFTLVVNGTPIYARGANWIPDDCFPPRITATRYRDRVVDARAANVDLLRVWGGGIYESDDFYDACDELGILVWQDFLFACAAYSEDEPLRGEVDAEARDNVERLMPHPSLALWNGCNENIWGYFAWGWRPQLGERSWGAGYYLELLPAVLAEIDPSRPYWPGSPYSGSMELEPNDPAHGCMHIWDVWNQVDYSVYRDYVPRFAAEYGWQAPPTWSTLTEAIHDQPIAPLSPSMYAHQKAPNGDAKLNAGLAPHFPPPRGTEQWLWAMQLNQARAVTTGITHQRSHRGVCMGSVVWQLNDCWPVISWAAIDGAGRPKPLWHALRRAYAPVLLTVQPRGERLVAALVSEQDELCTGELVAQRVTFGGDVLATARVDASLSGRGVVEVELPADVATPADASAEVLVVRMARPGAAELRDAWFFAPDRELEYPKAGAQVTAERDPDGTVVVHVRATTLLRDIYLQADRVSQDARSTDGLVTLLPGDQITLRVSGVDQQADLSVFGHWPVLCTANDLVAG